MQFQFKDFPELKPIVVGIWCGIGKPNKLNEFLMPFVQEVNSIATNGLIINGHRLDVSIRSVICDSPARSYIKGLNSFLINK